MAHRREKLGRGFTLIEMLTVVTMTGVLMSMVVVSMTKAQKIARRTKAEAEMREMCNAWLQYQMLYGKLPGSSKNGGDTTASMLDPLINPKNTENPMGVVFLNLTLGDEDFCDPWGTPYQISFGNEQNRIRRTLALETSVFLKFAQ